MIPPSFDYHAPKTLPEALALLGAARRGGQGPLRRTEPAAAAQAPLRPAGAPRGHRPHPRPRLHQGGRRRPQDRRRWTREAALEASDLVRSKYPILADTAAVIADPLVRNLATVCGNLAHGDPANDHPATMLALGAEVVATGPKGDAHDPDRAVLHRPLHDRPRSRRDADRDPHPGPAAGKRRRLRQARAQGRRLRHRGRGARSSALKGGVIERAGIGLTNVGPTPIKAAAAETLPGRQEAGRGRRSRRRRAWPAAAAAPRADRRGSVEYKKEMARVLTVAGPAQGRSSAREGSSHGEAQRSASPSTAPPTRRRSNRACCSSTSCARTSGSPAPTSAATPRTAAPAPSSLDGVPVKSCTVLAVQADGRERHAPSKGWRRTASSTRSRKASCRSTGCSAASARRA